MKVRKAVITAAGKSQRTLPLQTLVDRDGSSRSALAILAEEITSAGIEEIAVPGVGSRNPWGRFPQRNI